MGLATDQAVGVSRRETLAMLAAVGVPSACHAQASGNPRIFRPEEYGARGDGQTNDTAAFAALAAALNRLGGGTVVLRKTVYIVGAQRYDPGGEAYLFAPQPIMAFTGCPNDVVIEGNGATLRSASGLRYGVFDPRTRRSFNPTLPFYERKSRAAPYEAMVRAERCRGRIMVRNLVLDGNADTMILGGRWGDTGWQIAGSGIVLQNNVGAEIIEDVVCRNHPLDGIMIDGVPYTPNVVRRLTNVVMDRNGRQGCSIVGGGGYVFENCQFSRTGRGPIGSAPGAGVDIEPENESRVRNLRFVGCRFSENAGPGLLTGGQGSSDVTCVDSVFVGTTAWAAWPNAPRYRFQDCTFIGATSNCYGDRKPADATSFEGCTFTDVLPSDGPTHVFLGDVTGGPIVDVSSAPNVRFSTCTFTLRGLGRLPWSTAAIYHSCTMEQRSAATAYPRGTWLGRSVVRGKVDIGGATIAGQLIVNGMTVTRTQ